MDLLVFDNEELDFEPPVQKYRIPRLPLEQILENKAKRLYEGLEKEFIKEFLKEVVEEVAPHRDIVASRVARKARLKPKVHLDDPREDFKHVKRSQGQTPPRPLLVYSDTPFDYPANDDGLEDTGCEAMNNWSSVAKISPRIQNAPIEEEEEVSTDALLDVYSQVGDKIFVLESADQLCLEATEKPSAVATEKQSALATEEPSAVDNEEPSVGATEEPFMEATDSSSTEKDQHLTKIDMWMRELVGNSTENATNHQKEILHLEMISAYVLDSKNMDYPKKCCVCSEVFLDFEKLTSHLFRNHLSTKRHPSERAQCPNCHEAFPVPANLMTHFNKVHKPEKLVSATRCKRQDCQFKDKIEGVLCPKEHVKLG